MAPIPPRRDRPRRPNQGAAMGFLGASSTGWGQPPASPSITPSKLQALPYRAFVSSPQLGPAALPLVLSSWPRVELILQRKAYIGEPPGTLERPPSSVWLSSLAAA